MTRRFALSSSLFFLVLALADGPLMADDRTGVEYFEKHVRPLLATHCYECHGEDTRENELRLDTAAGLQVGGVSGRAVAPGKPNGSLLVTAVRYVDSELQMPPTGKLDDAEVEKLVRWVEMGAPVPGASLEAAQHSPNANGDSQRRAAEHWAFQPPERRPLPEVKNEAWARTPIDRFVLARLEAEGLTPAPPADRRTLIRRATFDLIGLPPTPEEVEAFLADDSPQAFAKVVDRLLASPRYGERWGRHWLDLARYADSNGLDENVAHGNAWRYRDWVIDAFNDDKPYDQFVREQLAGDLLPANDRQTRNEQLVATGFLSLGPKVLAEVDERKMEMDIVDEQINTVSRSLLAITVACARCHDHKFDPISTKGYYSLAGVFKSTRSMETFQKVARWHENPLYSEAHEREKTEHERKVAAKRQKLKKTIAEATAKLQEELGAAAALPEKPEEHFPEATRKEINNLREEVASLEENAPAPPTAMGVTEGEPHDAAVHIRGSHLTLGDSQPRGLPEILAVDEPLAIPADQSGRLQVAQALTRDDHPLTARVLVNRLWRWHFGRGLVKTTDNFGRLGAEPTHPALLDWLAIEFTRRGWSIKQMHRLMMRSAVYQMSSETIGAAAQVDPENRLLSRANIRRLEAEEIRDGLLSLSGMLTSQMGGSLLGAENRAYIFDHTSRDATTYSHRRRSVYLPVIRNHLHDAFMLFDYTDASVPQGDRNTSTVASQALYLMNSDLLAEVSEKLAGRLLRQPAEHNSERIAALYELALNRPARSGELRRAEEYLDRFERQLAEDDAERESARRQAWRLLCQAVLMSNEFFYIR